MKKIFNNPFFAVLFSLVLIVLSSISSTKIKTAVLTPEQLAQAASVFPGNVFIR